MAVGLLGLVYYLDPTDWKIRCIYFDFGDEVEVDRPMCDEENLLLRAGEED